MYIYAYTAKKLLLDLKCVPDVARILRDFVYYENTLISNNNNNYYY